MGFYYRKRIKILPGVRLNLSKSGISMTVGKRGASMNFNKSGTYMNAGIPGFGIYTRTRISQNTQLPTMKAQHNAWTNSKQWGCAMLLLFTFIGTGFLLCGNVALSLCVFFTGFLLYQFITREKSKNAEVADKKEDVLAMPATSSEERASDVSEVQTADMPPSNAVPEIDEDFKGYIIDCIARKNAGYNIDNDSDISCPDPMLKDAAQLIVTSQCGSTTMIQRKFSIGYNRAGRIMDQLEKVGIVGPARGAKPREVLMKNENQLANLSTYYMLSTQEFINKYSLEDEINSLTRYYIDRKAREEEERERLLIEEEKERIKQDILKKRDRRELRKQAMEELKREGMIENVRKREPIPQDVQDAVWRRDGGRCVKCGSQENLEFDHIIPFSKGGSNTVRNLQLLCEKCNREKSNNIG